MPETEQKEFSGPKDIKDKSDQRTWNALDANEQIERMRGIIKDLQHRIDRHDNGLQELRELTTELQEHGHTDGQVTISVKRKRRESVGVGSCAKITMPGWF